MKTQKGKEGTTSAVWREFVEQNHDLQPSAMQHRLETVPMIDAKSRRSWLVSPSPSAKPSTHLWKGRSATAVVNVASSQAGSSWCSTEAAQLRGISWGDPRLHGPGNGILLCMCSWTCVVKTFVFIFITREKLSPTFSRAPPFDKQHLACRC